MTIEDRLLDNWNQYYDIEDCMKKMFWTEIASSLKQMAEQKEAIGVAQFAPETIPFMRRRVYCSIACPH